ncbi:MAG: glycosyltransferase family 25 protein [Pseudolabrys sp.]|nr:glycosyltransferase family 25 protein [Pseudolabrys sp.]MBV9956412.1 glycosyltransferase family 25 protein [Pseudolabrys sp.]
MSASDLVPVAVINLRRSTQRREETERRLNALGVPFTIFEAVDAQAMTPQQIASLAPQPYLGRPLANGELALAESFRRLLAGFVAEGGDYLCVLEDDAELTPATVHFMRRGTINALPPFDVLRLEDDPLRAGAFTRIVARHDGHAVHAPLRLGFFTWGQVFSRAGAQKVVDGLVPLWAPIDNLLFREAGIVGLRVLEVRPGVVTERKVETDIPQRYAVKPRRTVKKVFNRKRALLARRCRAVWSYFQAWGWPGLLGLRLGR